MRPLSALPPLPEGPVAVDWRAVRESMRAQLDRALLGDIALANVYTHVSLGGACRVCGEWSMGTLCAACLMEGE